MNPFRHGKPVPPAFFVGRQDAVRTIFPRIHNGESTGIIGQPQIGKSSLLRYLAEPTVQSEWLQEAAVQHAFVAIDCHLLPQSHQAADFWKATLAQVQGTMPDPALQRLFETVRQSNCEALALESLFRQLGRRGVRVVLLIDEFDALLYHPNFNRADFFGALRSLSSRTDVVGGDLDGGAVAARSEGQVRDRL